MRRLWAGLLAIGAFLLLAGPVKADTLLTLTPVVGNTVGPQSTSNPCIICATNASQPVGFGYNNFTSDGNIATYNMFSDALASRDHAGDGIQNLTDQAYTSGFLRTFLSGLGDANLTFAIAIDVNTAQHGETLNSFQLIDLDTPGGASVLAHYTGPTVIGTGAQNGNGFADFLLTGFDLSNVDVGDRLIFHANWSNASDGGESFFLVASNNIAAVPELSTWAMMILGFAGVGLFGMRGQRIRLV